MSFMLKMKMIGQKNSPVAHQNLLDLPILYLHQQPLTGICPSDYIYMNLAERLPM